MVERRCKMSKLMSMANRTSRMRSIECCYFQWPWVTPNYFKPPHFRHFVTPAIASWWVEIETSNLVDRLIAASASPCMAKLSLKRAWSDDVNHVNFSDATVVKFCTKVGYVNSQHKNDKSPSKWRGQGHVIHFKFCGPNDIAGRAKARIVKFCKQVDCIESYPTDNQPPLKGALSWSHNPFSFSMPAIISPEWLKRESPNCR